MGIPQFFEEMLEKQYETNIVNKIKLGYECQKKVTLRVNTIKSNINVIKEVLTKENIEFEDVKWNPDALIIKNKREEEIKKLNIYDEGKIYLQSLSSMIPAIILEPNKDENILDMAAAPGGKTTQIAAICNNKGLITACEKNKIRAERLKYNLQKQGVSCVNVMQEDARKLNDYFSFDKILLDAPCSGSGTLSAITENFTLQLVERSVNVQIELLTKALKILKPGNEMVYSTCSVLSRENEEVLNKVAKKYRIEIVPINIRDFEGVEFLPVSLKGTICVCPTDLYEGFFVAKIRKLKN